MQVHPFTKGWMCTSWNTWVQKAAGWMCTTKHVPASAKCRRECDWVCARATLCGDRACRVCEMQARVRLGLFARNPLRRSCVSSARNAGESVIGSVRATLCGDRACRVREMQARVRLGLCARNPLRRSCVSSARNAGESAIGAVRAQPAAEIRRVECYTHPSVSIQRQVSQ